jgi:hypothetical protein
MSAATIHRIGDIFDSLPQSSYSPEEKARILAEARANAAAAREAIATGSHAPVESRPDPIAKWRAEVDAREAEHEWLREIDRRAQEQRQQQREREVRREQRQQDRDMTEQWRSYIANQIELERASMCEAVGEIVAELTARIKALEKELQELRKR